MLYVASLGNLGSLQRCYATSGRLGCHRFSSPWLSSQLPPLSIATWYDGGSLWHERNAPYTCGAWCCWSVCWINKVCIFISLCIYWNLFSCSAVIATPFELLKGMLF